MVARNMFIKLCDIHIILLYLPVCTGDHTGAMVAGDNRLSPTAAAAETAPTGLCRNSQKINSFKNRDDFCSFERKIAFAFLRKAKNL